MLSVREAEKRQEQGQQHGSSVTLCSKLQFTVLLKHMAVSTYLRAVLISLLSPNDGHERIKTLVGP